MFFSKTSIVLAAAALSSVASAQYDYGSSGSSMTSVEAGAATTTAAASSPSGSVNVHVITAKIDEAGKNVFVPNNVQAAVGDMIQFQFWPRNHSVVRAAFDSPCQPLEGADGFYSGFMPVAQDATSMPTFTVMVNDTKPIWFYCSQGKHCQAGMVGVVNPTANRTIEAFTAAAALAPNNVSPGTVSGGSASSASGTGTGTGSTTLATSVTGTNSATASGTGTGVSAPANNNAPGHGAFATSGVAVIIAAVAASFFLA